MYNEETRVSLATVETWAVEISRDRTHPDVYKHLHPIVADVMHAKNSEQYWMTLKNHLSNPMPEFGSCFIWNQDVIHYHCPARSARHQFHGRQALFIAPSTAKTGHETRRVIKRPNSRCPMKKCGGRSAIENVTATSITRWNNATRSYRPAVEGIGRLNCNQTIGNIMSMM